MPSSNFVPRVEKEPMNRLRGGFTILELLIVLTLISIFAAVAIPAFFGRPDITLENASVLLARDLRAAQNRSAYMAEKSTFWFTPDDDGYCVIDTDGIVVENPTTGLDFVRRYSEDAVFDGVVVESVDCGGDRALEFDDQGRASEECVIVLRFEGETRTIRIARGNGRVTIPDSTSGWVDEGY